MSLADLDAEVERRKARGLTAAEPVRTSAPAGFNLASAMPEVMAAFERMAAQWSAFCDSIRPEFDAAPDTKACPHHPSVRRSKVFEETCQKSRAAGVFTAAYAPCGECDSAAAKTRHRTFWRKRGVPERVVEATLSSFAVKAGEMATALGKVQGWIKRNGIFLLLRGTTGTGKGHLAAGCLKAQGDGLWITQADMLSDLRASYTLHTTPAIMERWREAEMFVLDEFGLSPGGGDEESMLYQVLADRYDKRRPTIITTNLGREDFAKAIGYRLLDRIGEDCEVVSCAWPSHRTGK